MNILDYRLNIKPLNIFIDPQFPVEKAIISHAHADHAKPGNGKVLATRETIEIMKLRYGEKCANSFQIIKYGEKLKINNINISMFPAGHVLGSAQILIEYKGYKTLVTGDYKTTDDEISKQFELIKCNTLISEATFGLPVFQHPNAHDEITKIIRSINKNKDSTHLIGCYALGKAQRVIYLLRKAGYDKTIYIHGALEKICNYYENQKIPLGKLEKISASIQNLKNDVVLAPPSAIKDRWSRKFNNKISCQASGWLSIKQRVKQNRVEIPLIISDHSDWTELTETIINSKAEKVLVTHGNEEGLVYWSKKRGLVAEPLSIMGRGEEID